MAASQPLYDTADTSNAPRQVKPRIILHGGAGNITRKNLPVEQWHEYRTSLLRILRSTASLLEPQAPSYSADSSLHTTASEKAEISSNKGDGVDALTAAVHAVQLLETDPLFNAGIGAVFNREGRIELEASVMVSSGSRKRGVGVSGLKHVRSPVGLAAEMLRRGDEGPAGGGAQGHMHLYGESVEALAREWGCEMCDEEVFYTHKRWEEHKRGLEKEKQHHEGYDKDPSWDPHEHLPQGTTGCVVLDRHGTIAVATSTGGITNKLPGRIGDTPTLGAGFWAEEWQDQEEKAFELASSSSQRRKRFEIAQQRSMYVEEWTSLVTRNLSALDPFGLLAKCLPISGASHPTQPSCTAVGYGDGALPSKERRNTRHAVGIGATGNGDSFLRLSAVRTAAARVRFGGTSLSEAMSWMADPGGELQRSAEDRWGVTGEGEGGMIGIELKEGKGTIVAAFNRAMFRAWVDEDGRERCMIFKDEY